jgi:RNA polymerase sigma-70 factor (ECF subfamily)
VDAERTELLVRLLSRHQQELLRYTLSLVPHDDDAHDVLQETSVALWRKFGEYESTRPFLAWAHGFAYLEVLKYRERGRHQARPFTAELLEQLSDERAALEPILQTRAIALEACLAKLSSADRELIRRRYHDRAPTEKLAQEFGASRRTFFRNLERIRRLLVECIRRHLGSADAG